MARRRTSYYNRWVTSSLLDRAVARNRPLLLDDADDVADAAAVLAAGGVIGQGFGNFYVLTTRPDAATVRRINLLKGRPADQVGSVVTTPLRIPLLFDWGALPEGLSGRAVRSVMDALFELGPVRFPRPGRRTCARPPGPGRPRGAHDPGDRAGVRLCVEPVPVPARWTWCARTCCTSPRPTGPGI